MWGNSTPMSGCAQKVLSCIEVGSMSQTTLSSIMTCCMRTMQLWSQDTLDHGSRWNWCCSTAFISNLSHKLAALLGVKLTPSTSYHLQTDGQMECMNQEIGAYLHVFVSHQQDDWADWL